MAKKKAPKKSPPRSRAARMKKPRTAADCWCPIHYLGVWNGLHQYFVEKCGFSQFKGYSTTNFIPAGYCSGATCSVGQVPEGDCQGLADAAGDPANVKSRMRSIPAEALRENGLRDYVPRDLRFCRASDNVFIHDRGEAVEVETDRGMKKVRLLSVRLVVRCGQRNYATEWMNLGQELNPEEATASRARIVESLSDHCHYILHEVDGHDDLFLAILKGDEHEDEPRPPC